MHRVPIGAHPYVYYISQLIVENEKPHFQLVKCNLSKLTTTSFAGKRSTSLAVKRFMSLALKRFTSLAVSGPQV